jgi:hypothetical protein
VLTFLPFEQNTTIETLSPRVCSIFFAGTRVSVV